METEIKHTINLSDRMYKLPIALISVVAIFLGGFLVYEFKTLSQNNVHEIQVSGEGRAYAKSDVAIISLGAHTEAQKSQDAVNQNNKIMNAVIDSVKGLGVEEKDIQTTSYNLSPIYDWTENGRNFKGYALDQQVQVKIRNFDNISSILDKAAEHGANTIGDLQFTVDDMEKVRAEARQKAIVQAKEKAVSLFSQSGLRGQRLVNVVEGGFQPTPIPFYGKGGAVAMDSVAAPQIQTGQQEVNVTVTLIYQVK